MQKLLYDQINFELIFDFIRFSSTCWSIFNLAEGFQTVLFNLRIVSTMGALAYAAFDLSEVVIRLVGMMNF